MFNKSLFNLEYYFTPENSVTGISDSLLVQNATPFMRLTKTALWVTVAMLLSSAISQLS